MTSSTCIRKPLPTWTIDRKLPVIPMKFVIPGRESSNLSRVGDDEWDLRCAVARVNIYEHFLTFNFLTIDDEEEREFIREYLYLCMNFDHLGSCLWPLASLAPDAACTKAFMVRQFFRRARESGSNLHEIDQDWLDDWLEDHRHLSPSTLVHRISVLRRLYTYGPSMTFRSIEIKPWGSKPATKVARYKWRGENKTSRVPEEVYHPTLRWAMFMIDHGINDLICYRKNVTALGVNIALIPHSAIGSTLDGYIDGLRKEGHKVPLRKDGHPSLGAISRATGISWSSLRSDRSKAVIQRAVDEFGGEPEGQSFDWSVLPGTSTPWNSAATAKEAFFLLGQALGACYLVVGLLSGMRDSEVTALERNRLNVVKGADGQVRRYEVNGFIYKGSRKKGVVRQKHTWVVIEPVARAIEAAKRIQDHLLQVRTVKLKHDEEALLFARPTLHDGNGASMKGGQSNGFVNAFAKGCEALLDNACADATEEETRRIRTLYGVPDLNGGVRWRWQSRQLRRTLAWFIANQPFGVIAGMLQYGHASEIIFEGYAGTSTSGFRDEIEQERQIARLADIVETYEAWKNGEKPGGPMASKLINAFEHIQEELGDLPGVIADEARRDRMLRNTAVTLYPGFINDCFYYKEHALCQTAEKTNDTDTPLLNRCIPQKCPNSLVRRKHLPALEACLADAEGMLAQPKLSLPQATAIKRMIGVYHILMEEARH